MWREPGSGGNNAATANMAGSKSTVTSAFRFPLSLARHRSRTRWQLRIVRVTLKNNQMRFGDLLVKQLKGIAMGMSPAPTIANLFVAIHEASDILQFVGTSLLWLKRFIDDGFVN